MPTTVSTRQRNGKRSGKTVQEIVTSQIIQALESGRHPLAAALDEPGRSVPDVDGNRPALPGDQRLPPPRGRHDPGLPLGHGGAASSASANSADGSGDEQFGKPVLVILWKARPATRRQPTEYDQETQERRAPVMRFYKVWNAEQCDGPAREVPGPGTPPRERSPSTSPPSWSSRATWHREPSLTDSPRRRPGVLGPPPRRDPPPRCPSSSAPPACTTPPSSTR